MMPTLYSSDEPVRYNENKVDWTLLPWDEDIVKKLITNLNYYSHTSNTDYVVYVLLEEDIESLLAISLLLLDNIRVTFSSSQLPWDALEQVCRVFQYGCVKYSRDNYKLAPGLPLETYIQSMWRHSVEYLKGNLTDEESKLSHLAHLACNCFMYLWTVKNYGSSRTVNSYQDLQTENDYHNDSK